MIAGLAAAQSGGKVSGKIIDSNTGDPLPGASVTLSNTSTGTSTDAIGNFTLDVSQDAGTITVSFLGYISLEVPFELSQGSASLGTLSLQPNLQEMEGVVVVGVADIAKDRETPVAASTIRADEIQLKLGSQEFPEILKETPSVYVTKQGGGFGDSRINVRGFDQRNTAVMINGVPINDMENGWVYWSNWAGLSDVTSAMQVQRGLGSSKLAISSVGGTINILTRSSLMNKGGSVMASMGNDGYMKFMGAYNTGKMENGLSVSALFSSTSGDGFADGTKFEGYNYFLGLGYDPNEQHSLQLTLTGAPQWHHQRSFAPSLYDYIAYGDGEEPERKYNSDWGYLNGEEYGFVRNFYHKPVASVNWDWQINEKLNLSTVAYASWGRGGGTGEIGTAAGARQYDTRWKTSDGLIDVDRIYRFNSGQSVEFDGAQVQRTQTDGMYLNTGNGNTTLSNGITRRASVNSHNWYGILSSLSTDLSEMLTLDIGIDLRTYKGIHYRRVNDLLGGDAYLATADINNPERILRQRYTAGASWWAFGNTDEEEKIDYYNDGLVNWTGVFGQLEYRNDALSAFIQFSGSNQGYKRVEYFLRSGADQESAWENILGGNIKGGANYNIDDKNNVFFNAGYYSRQPNFDAVWINFDNILNPDLANEKVLGLELGYGFRAPFLRANLNLYRTSWTDRFESSGVVQTDPAGNILFEGTANYTGVEQVHTGVEVDFSVHPSKLITINGMLSAGNWEYAGTPVGTVFDDDRNVVGESNLVLDGVKVGDAAQFTSHLGLVVEPLDGLRVDAGWFHAAQLYADFDIFSFQDENTDGVPDNGGFLLELPSYDLFDAGISYRLQLKNKMQSVGLRLNVNNVFDQTYMSEADTNLETAEDQADNWKGINKGNRVYFGYGRTWNLSLRYNF